MTAISLIACGDDTGTTGKSSTSSGSSGTASSAKFEADVMPILLNNCAFTACHGSKESHLGILLTADKAQTYAELQKTSPTYNNAKFVVPGKPDESFLIAKIENKQGSFAGCSGGCGKQMPQDETLAKADITVLRTWITNGAKND